MAVKLFLRVTDPSRDGQAEQGWASYDATDRTVHTSKGFCVYYPMLFEQFAVQVEQLQIALDRR